MNLAVVVVVLALAGATFVLSYNGVHSIALHAGVSARLARVYPATFDAVLIIACIAAVMLRDARWWSRCYAWLTIILMMAVVGAADAVHAMNVTLPHRQTEGVVAAAPWVLALLGFSLMLTMFRHSRAQHGESAPSGGRAARRAARRAAGQDTTPPVMATEPPAELARHHAPALPPAAPHSELPDTGGQPPTQALPSLADPGLTPFADPADPADPADQADRGPAVTSPAPGALAAEPAQEAQPAPETQSVPEGASASDAQPVPAADSTTARPAVAASAWLWHTTEPDLVAVPGASHTDAAADPDDADKSAPAATEPDAMVGSDESSATRVDYWDTDEERRLGENHHSPQADLPAEDQSPFATAPFTTAPRLNRVRATPAPPEEDEEQ